MKQPLKCGNTDFQCTKRNDNLIAIFNLWCWKNIDTPKLVLSWIGIKVTTQVLYNTRIYEPALAVNFVFFSQLHKWCPWKKKIRNMYLFSGVFFFETQQILFNIKVKHGIFTHSLNEISFCFQANMYSYLVLAALQRKSF